MTASPAVLGLAAAAYLAGAALLGANLFLRRGGLLLAGRAGAIAGVLLHACAIGLRCAELHRAPFATPAESVSLLAWLVALAYLGTEVFWKLSASGPFALGLAFLLVLGGGVWHGANAPMSIDNAALLSGNAVSLHILATVAAIGAFALAFCCAALYLLVHHILKSKHGLIWMRRLPPLMVVEQAAFVLVAVGFPLLTLGILSGLVRAWAGGLAPGWQTDPKTLLAYLVWGVYAIYLFARMGANWPPVRTAYILLIGLGLSLLLFVVPSGAHRFG